MEISREEFESYEMIRKYGMINMLDVNAGTELTGLTETKYIYIIKHYRELYEKFIEKE